MYRWYVEKVDECHIRLDPNIGRGRNSLIGCQYWGTQLCFMFDRSQAVFLDPWHYLPAGTVVQTRKIRGKDNQMIAECITPRIIFWTHVDPWTHHINLSITDIDTDMTAFTMNITDFGVNSVPRINTTGDMFAIYSGADNQLNMRIYDLHTCKLTTTCKSNNDIFRDRIRQNITIGSEDNTSLWTLQQAHIKNVLNALITRLDTRVCEYEQSVPIISTKDDRAYTFKAMVDDVTLSLQSMSGFYLFDARNEAMHKLESTFVDWPQTHTSDDYTAISYTKNT